MLRNQVDHVIFFTSHLDLINDKRKKNKPCVIRLTACIFEGGELTEIHVYGDRLFLQDPQRFPLVKVSSV